MNKSCLNCPEEIPVHKYFCSIECEIEHTDRLNKEQYPEVVK